MSRRRPRGGQPPHPRSLTHGQVPVEGEPCNKEGAPKRPLPPLPDRTGARGALQRCPILPTAQLEYHGNAKRGGDIFIELRMGTFLKSFDIFLIAPKVPLPVHKSSVSQV